MSCIAFIVRLSDRKEVGWTLPLFDAVKRFEEEFFVWNGSFCSLLGILAMILEIESYIEKNP